MLKRRDLMVGAAAVGACAPFAPGFGQAPDGEAAEAAKMNALFDGFVRETLERQPEEATSLGLDKGDLAILKSRLSDASPAAVAKEKTDNARRMRALETIDRSKLSAFEQVSYDTVMFTLAIEDEGNQAFDYGGNGAGAPYVLSQLTGSYQSVPDFLDTQHAIETKDDADAYLSRLNAFATMMDQELEQVRHDVGLGVTPPDFVIDKTLIQMDAFLKTPADQSSLVQSLVRRAGEKNLTGDYGAKATTLYAEKILPALARQAAFLREQRPKATHDAGVTRLPNGAQYYRVSLKNYTTATIAAEVIHKTGLDLVTSLSADLDALLKAQGLSQGGVGARLAALTADPKYLYDNTDAAKERLIADLNAKVVTVQAKLPDYFGKLPKAKVEIRRVPKAIEAGAPGGYYEAGSLDGTRPGAYYINLRDTAEQPSWTLSTLTYHEAIPGHHLQISIAQEADSPLIRKLVFYSAYAEGWALYAEQLADEMGLYDHDPMGKLGYLHDALFRAVRLVVDSGMHSKRWSREQAIQYMVETVGDKDSAATTEIERYCVWPGQACGYMLGKIEILRLREEAEKKLGSRFDLRKFHDAILKPGAMPLDVLAQVVDEYVKG